MKHPNYLKKYILFSVAVHIGLFFAVVVTSRLQKIEVLNTPIEVSFLEQSDAELKKSDPKLIVESDSNLANEKLNEKTKYLSEKSNSVEKETKAKLGQKFLNSKQSINTRVSPALKQQVAQQKYAAPKTKPKLFEQGFDAYSALNKKNIAADIKQQGQARADRAAASANNQEASTTNDNLENIHDDLMTRLNTREYKYFGYYNRIKTQLNQWWVPEVQLKFTKMIKQGRTIASSENKITKLVIILNKSGNLVKVQVLAESGVRDLDDAAVDAFRQAAPFPNPPQGMMETDGTVRIRWDCVVES